MSKIELINELQSIIGELNNASGNLGTDLSSLMKILDNKDFIPGSLRQKICEELEYIEKRQTQFIEKYTLLGNEPLQKNYAFLESDLAEKKEYYKIQKYIDAVKFFMKLQSSDEKVQSLLEKRQEDLKMTAFESMTEEEIIDYAFPYVQFRNAFQESDDRKRFSIVFGIGNDFEMEVLSALQFGDINASQEDAETVQTTDEPSKTIIEEQTDIEKKFEVEEENEIKEETQPEEKVCQEESESKEAEDIQTEDKTTVEIETEEKGEEDSEDCFKHVDLNNILIPEDTALLKTSKSKKAETEFKSKKFINEMLNGKYNGLLQCFLDASTGMGFLPDNMGYSEIFTLDQINAVVDKLYNLGYIQKHEVENLGYFYKSTNRGLKAFTSKESRSFIQTVIKRFKIEVVDTKLIETANAAKMRLLAFDAEKKANNLIVDDDDSELNVSTNSDFFMLSKTKKGMDYELCFVGIITENTEQLKEFKKFFERKNKDNNIYIVCSFTEEHAKAVADWMMNDFDITVNEENFYYTVYREDNIYNVKTGKLLEPIQIEDENSESVEAKENDEEAAQDDDLNELFKDVDINSILVEENTDLLKIEESNKASGDFSVRKFKKEMSGFDALAKMYCLVHTNNALGFRPNHFDASDDEDLKQMDSASNKLYNLGYIRKYTIDDMGYVYTLSARGKKAFTSTDSRTFIKEKAKEMVEKITLSQVEIDTANQVKGRVVAFDSLEKLSNVTDEFHGHEDMISRDFFLIRCSMDETNNSVMLVGIVTENLDNLKFFKEVVEERLEENDYVVVCGLSKEQTDVLCQWFNNILKEKMDKDRLYYTVFKEEGILNFTTGQTMEFIETAVDESDESDEQKPEDESSNPITEQVEPLDKTENEEILAPETEPPVHVEPEKKEEPTDAKTASVDEPDHTELPSEEKENEDFPEKKNKTVSKAFSDTDISYYKKAYEKMIVSGHIYAAAAYLKVLSEMNEVFVPYYRQLSYAVNDPMAKCTYNSNTIIDEYYAQSTPISDYYAVSAALRNYFSDQFSFDYSMRQLNELISENRVVQSYNGLKELINVLIDFKSRNKKGIDRYADYRENERRQLEKRLAEVKKEAAEQIEILLSKVKENKSNKRFLETQKLLLNQSSDLYEYLTAVENDDSDILGLLVPYLEDNFVKQESNIIVENIDSEKIHKVINAAWNKAAENMREIKKSSDLMGSLRNNLYNRIYKSVTILCEYVSLKQLTLSTDETKALREYARAKTNIDQKAENILTVMESEKADDISEQAGREVLRQTLQELIDRLNGKYLDGSNKYFYIEFLANDEVVLDEYGQPLLDEVPEVAEMSILNRIENHCNEPKADYLERLKDIFDGQDDYGSAQWILKYLSFIGTELTEQQEDSFDIQKGVESAAYGLNAKRAGFIEDVELAQSYGQIDNTEDNNKENILQVMDTWYQWALQTKNYGFFYKILECFKNKIKEDARERAIDLESSLRHYQENNPEWSQDDRKVEVVKEIRFRIEKQNYAAAEDLLNRLLEGDIEVRYDSGQEDYFKGFLDEYDNCYRKTANTSVTLQHLTSSGRNKDIKGGNRLLENWPKNFKTVRVENIQKLLIGLGFNIQSVKQDKTIDDRIISYSVTLKRPENGRKANYKHPIHAFGSMAEEFGFRVAVIFGKTDASRLIDTFNQIGNAKNTIVILDFALTLADRRTLARKAKTDMTGKTFAVIDRVVIYYLSKHYSETAINRMLMGVIMPFAYFQPYVGSSVDRMPPELFIGRKYELAKIESPTGANIVYGGRQLGKSALLKQAEKDIDHNENGDRAAWIDIRRCDYKAAARKISQELYDKKILKKEHITEDWDELERDIRNRLEDDNPRIPYLLLLIDEADAFIESCEAIDYKPFDAFERIQNIGSGRFKFVVAGLRNIVRFKQEVALSNNRSLTHLESLTITPFKSTEARELLEQPLSYLGFRFEDNSETDALISTIFAATNYFPGLLQLYCSHLIEAMRQNYAGYSEFDTPPYYMQQDHVKKVLAEQTLQSEIREKFSITLRVGDDNYYYIIALLAAHFIQQNKSQNGCSAEDLYELAKGFSIPKITELSVKQLVALMEEMRELNILQRTGEDRYRFTRYNFFQMMGTREQLEEELMVFMED